MEISCPHLKKRSSIYLVW